MGGICKVEKKDLKYAVEKIDYWYKKNIRFLTIVTVPFNTSCIFSEIIDSISQSGGKILYVWGKEKENREIVTALKQNNSQVSHSYIEKSISNASLCFTSYKNLNKINMNFDLVIFDDITYFSSLTTTEIREYLNILSDIGQRVIFYGIEKASFIGEKIELAAYNYKQPFVEPRVLTTRIDLNNDIPYTLFDYLKWFKENKHDVVIYIPDREKITKIYDYFENKLKFSETKVLKVCRSEEVKRCERVLKYKDKAIFIITNKIEELLEYCSMDDAVLMFSDDEKYSYKKILYICGKMRNLNIGIPEVLLVANNISEDMDKAKDMAREFNKRVWEKRLKEL